MFIPMDPGSVDGVWGRLLRTLSLSKSCPVVMDGLRSEETICRYFGGEEALGLLEKLKSRDYVRIGSSRMVPMPAYFSIDFTGRSGRLMELISRSSDRGCLINDLSLVCQFSFFENKQMEKLVMPVVIPGLEDPYLRFEINEGDGETTVYRA